MENTIIIIGCGAQCKYAINTFIKTGKKIERVLDPIGDKKGTYIDQFLIGLFDKKEFDKQINSIESNRSVIICASNNEIKKDIYFYFKGKIPFSNSIHPDSTISSLSTLGDCLIINAGAVIQPYSQIGNGVMIHSGVIIEHDNIIGDFSNIAPGVTLAGCVAVGEGTTIYTGTTVAPNVTIGSNTIVGAGSLVLHNLPDNVLAYGSPAKIVKELD